MDSLRIRNTQSIKLCLISKGTEEEGIFKYDNETWFPRLTANQQHPSDPLGKDNSRTTELKQTHEDPSDMQMAAKQIYNRSTFISCNLPIPQEQQRPFKTIVAVHSHFNDHPERFNINDLQNYERGTFFSIHFANILELVNIHFRKEVNNTKAKETRVAAAVARNVHRSPHEGTPQHQRSRFWTLTSSRMERLHQPSSTTNTTQYGLMR